MIGEKKLNLLTVAKIKEDLKAFKKVKDIAQEYSISDVMVYHIKNGKRWPDERPKIKSQKDEGMLLPRFSEDIQGYGTLMTKACEIITPVKRMYIVMSFNPHAMTSSHTKIFNDIPTFEELFEIHNLNTYLNI